MRILLTITATLMLVAAIAVPASAAGGTLTGELIEVLHQQGVISEEAYGELSAAGANGDEQSQNRRLIEILHEQGTINDAAYGRLRARAMEEGAAGETSPAASTPRSSMTSPPAEGAGRPFEEALASVEEGFARLGGNKVKLKIGTWTQLGWVADDASTSTYFPGVSRAFADSSSNQFFVRYARLYFNGKLGDKIGFRVMLDAAPTSSNVLRDAFIYADYIPYARITLGQYLTPFGDEVWRAPFDVPTINYSMASTFSQLGVSRDIGVMLSGSYKTETSGGLPYGAGYAVSLINGNGANANDNNDHKDVIGRVYATPFVPGLSVGGSFYSGRNNFGSFDEDRDRWGVEMDYEPPYARGLKLRGEYQWDRRFFTTYAAADAAILPAFARHTHSDGWYLVGSYRISGLDGIWKYLNDLEPLARYEQFDEDTAVDDNERRKLTLGFNYYFNKYIRLMANYEIIHADGALSARSLQTFDNESHKVFMTNLQIWF